MPQDELTYEELKAAYDALKAKDDPEEVDAEVVSEPPVAGAAAPTPINAAPAPAPEAPKALPADWPVKGYTGPQPWEVDDPPALGHGHGLLITGSAGADVEQLSRLLAYAGYETSVSRGENPLAIFDGTVRGAVEQFRRDYGIQEDPGVISAAVADVVGPWTWAALYRLGRRPREA